MKKKFFVAVLVVLLMVTMVGCSSTATSDELNMTSVEFQSYLAEKYDLVTIEEGGPVPILRDEKETILVEVMEWVIAARPTDLGVCLAVSYDDYQETINIVNAESEKLNTGRLKVLNCTDPYCSPYEEYHVICLYPNVDFVNGDLDVDTFILYHGLSLDEFQELNPEIDISQPITGYVYFA